MKLPTQPRDYNALVEQRRSALIEQKLEALQQALDFVKTGVGLPSYTPNGRAIYIRQDGGANTTLYVYEGSSWVAK